MQYPGPRLLMLFGLILTLPSIAYGQGASERQAIRGSALTAPPEIAKLLDAYKGNPDSARVARVLAEEAEATGFPGIPFDHLLVARAWRRADASDQAIQALEQIPPDVQQGMPLLERARVLLEHDLNRPAGTRAYWRACEVMDALTRREIEMDLLAISIPAEREVWQQRIAADWEDCGWLREFWAERAQRMALTLDDRVALHYRRLAHAREWFWIPRPRFQTGPADRQGRPAGLPMDDRGLIYLRMGLPETDEGFLGDAGTPFASFDHDESLPKSNCWPYPRSDGYRIFCFSLDRVRADGDYKLVEGVGGVPGTHFFQKYVKNSNLPKSAIFHRIWSRGGGLKEPWERALDAVESRAYGLQIAVATRDNIADALQLIPDVPDILPQLRARIETLRFLNPAARRWQVWLLTSVRAGDLAPSSKDEETATLDVSGHFSARAGNAVTVRPLPSRSLATKSVKDDTGIPLRAVFSADPGPLPVTVVIEDMNAPGDGAWLQDTVNVPAIGGLPQVSDLAVAQSEGGTWTRDGETFLRVSPAHNTNEDGSVHTYFEVYGVRSGTEYDVELRLVRADDAADIWRLGADDLAFRLQFRSEMSGDIGRHHLRLVLGDTKPGEYMLAVRIQTADSKAYSLPAITDLFVAKR